MEHIEDTQKPVVLDGADKNPTTLGSWRDRYQELAIRYQDYEDVDQAPTVSEFLSELKQADGAEYRRWKGGDFKMSNNTPVWVSNRGTSSRYKHAYQGVVDVTIEEDRVIINTAEVPILKQQFL